MWVNVKYRVSGGVIIRWLRGGGQDGCTKGVYLPLAGTQGVLSF